MKNLMTPGLGYVCNFPLGAYNIRYVFCIQDENYHLTNRFLSGSVLINDSAWWVTGGNVNSARYSSEIYHTPNKEWRWFVKFPEPGFQQGHCNLQINSTHYFMTGGYNRSDDYIVDITKPDEPNFLVLPPSQFNTDFAACGFIQRKNGKNDIMVAAGGRGNIRTNITEIFSLETMQWRRGPDLPNEIMLSKGIQFGDTMLVVGGDGSDGAILIFDNDNDSWRTLPQLLNFSEFVEVAFLVPEDAVNC